MLGITLEDCKYSNVSGNVINNTNIGIDLGYSDNNLILGNTVNNSLIGINFFVSNNNNISGNILINTMYCIYESDCRNNHFEDNYCPTKKSSIPSYNLFFLFGLLITLSVIRTQKIKKS